MINAWSLAYEVLFGNMDETYPIREDVPEDLWDKKIDTSVGAGNTGMNWSADQNPYYEDDDGLDYDCLLYTSPSPRDVEESPKPSSA